ncbi:MAG TPA: type I methionyl aminopeptidase [Dehalococcoidia bacterium]|nr:type I methionyl aminopeptidase [Dehalococcoidia bacterium]
MSVVIKSADEVAAMREAGRLNAEIRVLLRAAIRPGVSGRELDQLAKREIARRDAEPTFRGYAPGGRPPYPGAICFSVNEELVHGIPGDRALKEGDVVSIDLGVTYRGWVSDAAFTVGVGKIEPRAEELLRVTEEALWDGIRAAVSGAHLGDVSHAIGRRAGGYGIVEQYGGHGVGRRMHEEPHILNRGRKKTGMRLKAGMVLALEPMFALGHADTVEGPDSWTVTMRDGGLSAHFEETIAVTDAGPEVLTGIDEAAAVPAISGA